MHRTCCVAIVVLLALSPATVAEEVSHSWHLLTQSRGGKISLIKDLSKSACEFALNRALGQPATDEEKAAAVRRQQTRADDMKAEQDTWDAIHPECVDKNPRVLMLRPECLRSLVVTMSYTRMISEGDIISAECFE